MGIMKQSLIRWLVCSATVFALCSPMAVPQTQGSQHTNVSWVQENNGGTTVQNTGDISLDATAFPDAEFLKFVTQYDTNKDGLLSLEEREAVTTMSILMKRIENLAGLEYFPKLQRFSASGTLISNIDFSQNPELQEIAIYRNPLESLNITNNENLVSVDLLMCSVTELDVSHNTKLETLKVVQNELSEIDVSHNTALTTLSLSNNQLSTIDISQNKALTSFSIASNHLTSIDLSANTELTTLDVGANRLGTIDLSHNTQLKTLDLFGCNLSEIDLSKQEQLETLDLSSNKFTTLDLSHNTQLKTLDVNSNKSLKIVDVSANRLLERLSVGTMDLTSLDVTHNPQLKTLEAQQNKLTEIDLSQNTALTSLYLMWNDIQQIDLSANINLQHISLQGENLKTLDVSKNTALTQLNIRSNGMETLDLSQNTLLDDLVLYDTNIQQLDLSHNTAITSMTLLGNALTSLDTSNNPNLDYLMANNNQLEQINVTGNPKLTTLLLQGNNLKDLDLSANTKLKSVNIVDNPIAAVKLGENKININASNPTQIAITVPDGQGIDMKAYSSAFDPAMVSNVQGATMDENGVFTGWLSGSAITYTYNLGFDQSLQMLLIPSTETAEGMTLSVKPYIKDYDGKSVVKSQILSTATATVDGQEIPGSWDIPDYVNVSNAGTYRVTVVFTPDDLTTYQPKGIQTVVQINPATLWVFPVLSTNHILLNEAIPTATGVSFDGIAEGDSMRTDVQPQISINEKPLLAGMYQIRITNTAEFLADLKNHPLASNYSFAFTTSSLFVANRVLPAPESPVPGYASRLDMADDLNMVPESLKSIGFETV